MASALKNILKPLIWLLPHGLYVILSRFWLPTPASKELISINELQKNKEIHNIHDGKRCFILGNGPSAGKIDLSILAGESVISVSNGYLHKNYNLIAPQYHCVPQITYGLMTEKDVVAWFTEMHEHIGSAELFLNETEYELVRKHNLFAGRKVHFLAMRDNFDELKTHQIPDLAVAIPRVQSVPVMAIIIAMYMGFKEIILLGVDHDHFKSRKYIYAFDLGVQEGKDYSVTSDGQTIDSWFDEFQGLARLWRHYRFLRRVADAQSISIYNATPGGELDEFPRGKIENFLQIYAEKN